MSLRAQSLKDIFTFTRATAANYSDINGVLATAAIDEPRVEYDPYTLAVRGMLIEEARTNYLLRTHEFDNAAWSKVQATISADFTTAPYGAVVADKLIEDSTASASHYVAQAYTKDSSSEVQSYALSVWAKAQTRTKVALYAQGSSGSANSAYAVFDLTNATAGTVTASGNYDNTQSSIERWANDWCRCKLVFRINNDAQAAIETRIHLANASGEITYSGDDASGLFIWGAQLEKGAYATSYIETSSAALSRSADICYTTTLTPWFNEDEGTLFVEYLVPWTYLSTDAGDHYLAEVDDGTVDERHLLYHSSGKAAGYTAANGSQQANPVAASTVTPSVARRAAYAWSGNDVVFAATGEASITTVTGTVVQPTGITTLRLGAYDAGIQNLNGYIRKVKFYPRRLTNAELAALVA